MLNSHLYIAHQLLHKSGPSLSRPAVIPFSRRFALAIVTAAATLSGCGGGGAEDPPESDSFPEVAADSGPTLVAVQQFDIQREVATRAEGSEVVWLARRVFVGTDLQPTQGTSSPAPTSRFKVEHDRAVDSFLVSGVIDDKVALEEYRFVKNDGRLYVVHDVYLEPGGSPAMSGRGLPVALDDAGSGGRARALATAAATPTISSISGINSSVSGISNGVISVSCGSYNGARVANDAAGVAPWTINGTSFGSTAGSVKLNGSAVRVTSWSSSRVVIDPTLPWSSNLLNPSLLQVTTANGATARYYLTVAPAIKLRVYGQCTYGVAKRRHQLGLQPSSTAYGGYSSFSASYVPRVGDQVQWSGKHQAIITRVQAPVLGSNGLKTYPLEMYEENYNCASSTTTTSTSFAIRGTTVVARPVSRAYANEQASAYYR